MRFAIMSTMLARDMMYIYYIYIYIYYMYTDVIITLVGGGASFGPAICYLPRWRKNESCQGLL